MRPSETAVHPRVCGEQCFQPPLFPTSDGSSPRVRGTESGIASRNLNFRFIPACAGNRTLTSFFKTYPTVHPRVCGEQSPGGITSWLSDGSSPRVRGTEDREVDGRLKIRFIPACAGNRKFANGDVSEGAVHPRVCGEQRCRNGEGIAWGGSSPRVRGTAADSFKARLESRFIPACAGNRGQGQAGQGLPTVHPRVCGEQGVAALMPSIKVGSSPRVRGTEQPGR